MPTDAELDFFISENMENLKQIFSIGSIFDIVVEHGHLYQSYLKLYPYIEEKIQPKILFSLSQVNLDKLITVTNLNQIAEIMTKLQFELMGYEGTYTDLKELIDSFVVLEKYEAEMDAFVETVQADDCELELVRIDNIIFSESIDYFQNLLNYINYFGQDNYLQFYQIADFDSLEMLQFLNENLDYDFRYFRDISTFEVFKYLYEETNFKELVDQTTVNSADENILTYLISDFEILKLVVDKYLYQDIHKIINHYKFKSVTLELIKYLFEFGYDYNNSYLYKFSKMDADCYEYLLQFPLSQESLSKLYFNLTFRNNNLYLMNKIYDRIEVFNLQASGIKHLTNDQLIKILDKVSDVNDVLKCVLTSEQLQIILNRYEIINPLPLVNQCIYDLGYCLYLSKDINPNGYVYTNFMGDDKVVNDLKIIDLLHKYNYSITQQQYDSLMAKYVISWPTSVLEKLFEYFKILIVVG